MPVVQAAVLLSLAAIAEGRAILAEDLGLLQGMHLNDLKGQVDSLGMLTLDDSNTAHNSKLWSTVEALESLVRRVAEKKAPPEGPILEAMEAFNITLTAYHTDLKDQITLANSQLQGIAETVNNCDGTPFSVDTSAVDSAESAFDKAHTAWNTDKTALDDATEANTKFLEEISDGQDCAKPDTHDDATVVAYFAHLKAIADRKAEYEQLQTSGTSAAAAEALSRSNLVTERVSHRTAVCTAQKTHHLSCLTYGDCIWFNKKAHAEKETEVTDLSKALTAEAEVIKKSMCYLDLLLNFDHTQKEAMNVDSCATGADGQLSQDEKDELKLEVGPDLDDAQPCTGLNALTARDACEEPTQLSNDFAFPSCAPCDALATQSTHGVTINDNDELVFPEE